MRYLTDLKAKVSMTDFSEIYKNYTNKNGTLKIDAKELKKIKYII